MSKYLRRGKEHANPIEAIQYTPDAYEDVVEFTRGKVVRQMDYKADDGSYVYYCTLMSEDSPGYCTNALVRENDYIIRTPYGTYRSIGQKFFTENYDMVED